MPFKKGTPKPAKSGRKKGTPNKKTLLRVEETLLELGINPIEEIIELMTKLKPAQRLEVWFDLYKFLEAPKRAGDSASPGGPLSPMSPVQDPNADPAAMLALVKQ